MDEFTERLSAQLMIEEGVLTTTINAGTTDTLIVNGTISNTGYAIGSLPTCNSGSKGAFAYVTNGVTSPSYLGTVSTTGSTVAPVFCNGSNWVYH